MNGSLIDRLAKGVAERTGSRRGVLRLVAGGVAAAALPSLLATEVEAGNKARAFCRSQGGNPVKGICRCVVTCHSNDVGLFRCSGNSGCSCTKSVGGHGVCVQDVSHGFGCSSTRDCVQAGDICTVVPDCQNSGAKCKTAATRPDQQHGCVKGRCQFTVCSSPCPLS